MPATATTTTEAKAAPVEKLYFENTLLRVAGVLFCHDAKRASARTGAIDVHADIAGKRIAVRPDPEFGQPGPLAHKIFVALLKKHSDYGRPIRNEISFSRRELMRLVGRKDWGGRDSQQLHRALNEIHHTFVTSSFKVDSGAGNKWAEHSFAIFPEIYVERAERATDPIEKCTVTLAGPIVASLENDHFTCLNHALMQELGTIGQALYMRLFFHFANLYDGHHQDRLAFPKRYDAICREWLGGLKVVAHKSQIERDQLGPHLHDLVRHGFLASYAITPAKSGAGTILTFRPGPGFFADYARFYRRGAQGAIQFQFHDDRREVAEPLKAAYLFVEKRTGHPLTAIPYVSSKEVETARQILGAINFDDIGDFIAFGLAEAARTRFDVQSLGGLRQYLPGYIQAKQRRVEIKAATDRRSESDRQDALRKAYDRFWSEEADKLMVGLSDSERAAIEAAARLSGAPGSRGTGSLAAALRRGACRRLAAARHPERIPSFDAWRERRPQP